MTVQPFAVSGIFTNQGGDVFPLNDAIDLTFHINPNQGLFGLQSFVPPGLFMSGQNGSGLMTRELQSGMQNLRFHLCHKNGFVLMGVGQAEFDGMIRYDGFVGKNHLPFRILSASCWMVGLPPWFKLASFRAIALPVRQRNLALPK